MRDPDTRLVVVSVSGGVAEVWYEDEGVEALIVDFDNLGDGDSSAYERYVLEEYRSRSPAVQAMIDTLEEYP